MVKDSERFLCKTKKYETRKIDELINIWFEPTDLFSYQSGIDFDVSASLDPPCLLENMY